VHVLMKTARPTSGPEAGATGLAHTLVGKSGRLGAGTRKKQTQEIFMLKRFARCLVLRPHHCPCSPGRRDSRPSHRAAVQALQRAASAFHFLASDVCRAGCFAPPSIALLDASLEHVALCAVQEIALRRGAAVQLSPKLLARLSLGLRDRYDSASRLSAMAGAPGGSLHAVCLDASAFWAAWGGAATKTTSIRA
jgi:hypothetical protein